MIPVFEIVLAIWCRYLVFGAKGRLPCKDLSRAHTDITVYKSMSVQNIALLFIIVTI